MNPVIAPPKTEMYTQTSCGRRVHISVTKKTTVLSDAYITLLKVEKIIRTE